MAVDTWASKTIHATGTKITLVGTDAIWAATPTTAVDTTKRASASVAVTAPAGDARTISIVTEEVSVVGGPTGIATLILHLASPVQSTETVTVTVAAGYIGDGVDTSPALTGAATDNTNNTSRWMPVVAGWTGPSFAYYCQQGGRTLTADTDFYFKVIVPWWNPVASVTVTVTAQVKGAPGWSAGTTLNPTATLTRRAIEAGSVGVAAAASFAECYKYTVTAASVSSGILTHNFKVLMTYGQGVGTDHDTSGAAPGSLNSDTTAVLGTRTTEGPIRHGVDKGDLAGSMFKAYYIPCHPSGTCTSSLNTSPGVYTSQAAAFAAVADIVAHPENVYTTVSTDVDNGFTAAALIKLLLSPTDDNFRNIDNVHALYCSSSGALNITHPEVGTAEYTIASSCFVEIGCDGSGNALTPGTITMNGTPGTNGLRTGIETVKGIAIDITTTTGNEFAVAGRVAPRSWNHSSMAKRTNVDDPWLFLDTGSHTGDSKAHSAYPADSAFDKRIKMVRWTITKVGTAIGGGNGNIFGIEDSLITDCGDSLKDCVHQCNVLVTRCSSYYTRDFVAGDGITSNGATPSVVTIGATLMAQYTALSGAVNASDYLVIESGTAWDGAGSDRHQIASRNAAAGTITLATSTLPGGAGATILTGRIDVGTASQTQHPDCIQHQTTRHNALFYQIACKATVNDASYRHDGNITIGYEDQTNTNGTYDHTGNVGGERLITFTSAFSATNPVAAGHKVYITAQTGGGIVLGEYTVAAIDGTRKLLNLSADARLTADATGVNVTVAVESSNSIGMEACLFGESSYAFVGGTCRSFTGNNITHAPDLETTGNRKFRFQDSNGNDAFYNPAISNSTFIELTSTTTGLSGGTSLYCGVNECDFVEGTAYGQSSPTSGGTVATRFTSPSGDVSYIPLTTGPLASRYSPATTACDVFGSGNPNDALWAVGAAQQSTTVGHSGRDLTLLGCG